MGLADDRQPILGGFCTDPELPQWTVAPQWNLCNAPGIDEPRIAKSKVEAVRRFLASDAKVLVSTHATFRFAVEELGIQAFDNRLIAIDEFHHVSANPDNKLGSQLGAFIARDKVHLVAMTGSYFRGDSEAVMGPADEGKFETVTYTYYEQLNGYRWLKSLDEISKSVDLTTHDQNVPISSARLGEPQHGDWRGGRAGANRGRRRGRSAATGAIPGTRPLLR